MPFTKTPYEIQREQQERAIRAQEEQQARQMAAQAWQSFANQDVGGEAIKPLNLPIDWQHGADIGAKHAAGVEQQLLEGQQKLEQIAAQGKERRDETAMELALKARYAPKKFPGGPGPVSKLAKELWDVHLSIPEDEQQAQRKNQRKTALIQELQRHGAGGRAEVEKFQYAVEHPYEYQYGPGTKRGGHMAELEAKEAGKKDGGYNPKGDIAMLKLKTTNDLGMPIPENVAAQQRAIKRLEEWSKESGQPGPSGSTPAPKATPAAPPAASAAPARTDVPAGYYPVKMQDGSIVYYNPVTKKTL